MQDKLMLPRQGKGLTWEVNLERIKVPRTLRPLSVLNGTSAWACDSGVAGTEQHLVESMAIEDHGLPSSSSESGTWTWLALNTRSLPILRSVHLQVLRLRPRAGHADALVL